MRTLGIRSLAAVIAAFAGLAGAGAAATTQSPAGSHARGIDRTNLELGDYKKSSVPRRGYLFTCQPITGNPSPSSGPWIQGDRWDLTAKPTVDGSVDWPQASVSVSRQGSVRTIQTNDLPDHVTGVFPIQRSDDAYQYDRNPNSISAQSFSVEIPARPKKAGEPSCGGGEVGILKSGVVLNNAFDAEGGDAVAHELQDSCGGHPHVGGVYHYHGLPYCIETGDRSEHSKRIGWALDGFPIFGPRGEDGDYMRNDDLNACHGHTHKISFNGSKQRLFHYHATLEFPYTVGCYMGSNPSDLRRP